MDIESVSAARASNRSPALKTIARSMCRVPLQCYLAAPLLSLWQHAVSGLLAACTGSEWVGYETASAVGYIPIVLGIFAATRRAGKAGDEKARWPCVVFALLPLFVLAIGPDGWMGPAVAAVGFAGMAWGYVRCAGLFTRMTFADATVCIVVSFILRGAFMGLADLPGQTLLLLAPFAPLCLEWACSSRPKSDPAPRPEHPAVRPNWPYAAALAFELVAFSFVAGLFDPADSPVGVSWLSPVLSCAVYLAVLPTALKCKRNGASLLFEAALVINLALFAVVLFGYSFADFAVDLTSPAHAVIHVALWLVVVAIAQTGAVPAGTAALVGWGLHQGAMGAGGFALAAIGDQGGFVRIAFVALAALVLAAIAVANRFAGKGLLVKEAPASGAADDDKEYSVFDPTVDRLCDRVGERAGLTGRELEVIRFVARGRSRGVVARDLCISENTVKGHMRNAYKKLGIHGRQELLDLLAREEARPRDR